MSEAHPFVVELDSAATSFDGMTVHAPRPMAPREAASPQVAPVATRPAPGNAPLSTRDIVRDLKARRRVVKQTIAAGKAAAIELAQIERLIEAASKTPAPVRALRSAG